MHKLFKLSVVAPDRKVVDEDVQSLVAPGQEGYLGVMAGHMPMIVALRPGLLEFRDRQDQHEFVALGGGFMEVTGDSVIVLADQAERAEDIDLKEAEEALEQARKALRGEDSMMTDEEATLELERAMVRIKAARNGNNGASKN